MHNRCAPIERSLANAGVLDSAGIERRRLGGLEYEPVHDPSGRLVCSPHLPFAREGRTALVVELVGDRPDAITPLAVRLLALVGPSLAAGYMQSSSTLVSALARERDPLRVTRAAASASRYDR